MRKMLSAELWLPYVHMPVWGAGEVAQWLEHFLLLFKTWIHMVGHNLL